MGTWGLSGGSGRVYRYRNRTFICAAVRNGLFFLVHCKKGADAGKCIEIIAWRHGAGGKYYNHFCADRLPDSKLADWRHNPFYPVSLCGFDRTQVLCVVYISFVLHDVVSDRYLVWYQQYHGSHLYDDFQCGGTESDADSRGCFIRYFFSETVVLPCLQAQYLYTPLPGQIFTGISGG